MVKNSRAYILILEPKENGVLPAREIPELIECIVRERLHDLGIMGSVTVKDIVTGFRVGKELIILRNEISQANKLKRG